MKKGLILSLIFIVILSGIVFADIQLKSYTLEKTYSPGSAIKGTIILDIKNVSENTLFTGFSSNISLIDFLDANDASYTCSPNCEVKYSRIGSAGETKQIALTAGETKTIGIRLVGNITSINGLKFDITSNAESSCTPPLKIDILSDEAMDWTAANGVEDFICPVYRPFGCYNDLNFSGVVADLSSNWYCERINIPPSIIYKVGANITKAYDGVEDVDIYFSVISESINVGCDNSTHANGEVSCIVQIDNEESQEVDVCISVDEENAGKYKIRTEEVEPCGYTDNDEGIDFPIFIRPGKYGMSGSLTYNESIEDEIDDYISEKYNYDCNPECIIPISFSGTSQTISVSNLNLKYSTKVDLTEKNIYDLQEVSHLISLTSEDLDLSKGNFIVPSTTGIKEFKLKLGDKELIKENINISASSSKIKSIIPSITGALVPTYFAVIGDFSTNTTYSWDFGDGDKETTTSNIVLHLYQEIKVYDLKVTAKNSQGEFTKIVSINVTNPKTSIPIILSRYNANLDKIQAKLNVLPAWIKTSIGSQIEITELKKELGNLSARYNSTTSNEGYIDIMEDLLLLDIPDSLDEKELIKSFPLLLVTESFYSDVMSELGLVSVDEDLYTSAVNSWIMENLNMKVDVKTYSLDYGYDEPALYSYLKVSITPRTSLSEFYFIVNDYPDEVVFAEDYGQEIVESSNVISYTGLDTTKTIEFLYPSEINVGYFPVYIFAPEIDVSEFIVGEETCGDGFCDNVGGEDYKNCREDCKPIGWTVFLLIGLLVGAFILYIILQEWYKRHYEKHLFPDRNHLFNLINFMNNANNQGVKKGDIFSGLYKMDWRREQVGYAWKKLNGLRTGMWEIPIFKFVERKEVKRELEKRTGTNVRPNFKGSMLRR
ncbi:MAG: PKD domain-containing protein [Candidatus Pacearchaeota archaeon]